MQLAVRTLGSKTGDQALMIGADGQIGPATRSAIARVINRYNVKSPTGGAPTAPQLQQKSVVSALTSAIRAKADSVTKPVPPAPSRPTRSPTVERLQRALVALGTITKQPQLKIATDGIAGQKTAVAVAAATGKRMSPPEVTANAEMLAREVEAKITAAGKVPPAKPADAPSGGTKRSDAIAQVQQLLMQLSALREDPALVVVVDGISGPKTAGAVNRVLGTKFSVAQVAQGAQQISARLQQVIAAGGKPPVVAQPAPTPEPDPQAEAETAQTQPVRENPGDSAGSLSPTAQPPAEPTAATVRPPTPSTPFPAPSDVPPPVEAEYIPPPPSPPAPRPPGPSFPDFPSPPPPSEAGAEMAPPEPAMPPPAESQPDAAPPAPAPAAAKPFPWVWVIGGAIAAVGVGATVYLMSGKGRGAGAAAPQMSPTRQAPARRKQQPRRRITA
jgi:hypothetical protein